MTTTAGRPLRDPAFRLLWLGEALASLAEQLFVVCLTLLVLDVAGPGATLGVVLAVAAVPRAVLLPWGGLLADRVDPARIVVAATVARTALLAVIAGLVLAGLAPIGVVAALAGLLGVLDAVYYPASLALLPRVVATAGLPRANALVQGAESAGDLLGPALAAVLVAAAGAGGGLSAVTGLYLLATGALVAFGRRFARRAPGPVAPTAPAARTTAPGALRAGLRYAWGTPPVRAMLLVLAMLNLAVVGPVLVGGAVLAEQRLGGAAALGIVFAGFGAGSLAGLVLAGARAPAHRRAVLAGGTAAVGIGTAALGVTGTLVAAVGAAAVIGLGAGYLGVVLVAWLQELVPAELRGRVLSLVVLASVAFDPVSYLLAGVLLPAGLPVLFGACGGLVVLTAAATLPCTSSG